MLRSKILPFFIVLCLQPLFSYSVQESDGRSNLPKLISGVVTVPSAISAVYHFYQKKEHKKKVDTLAIGLLCSHLARFEAQQPILAKVAEQFSWNSQTIVLSGSHEQRGEFELTDECGKGATMIRTIQAALKKKPIVHTFVGEVDTYAQWRSTLFQNVDTTTFNVGINSRALMMSQERSLGQAIEEEQSQYKNQEETFVSKSEYDRAVKKHGKHGRLALGSGIIAVGAGGCWLAFRRE